MTDIGLVLSVTAVAKNSKKYINNNRKVHGFIYNRATYRTLDVHDALESYIGVRKFSTARESDVYL